MKKIISFVILFVSILLLTGCGSNNNKYLQEISFDDLYTMVENKETFILEIMQDGCSHCAVFTPRFEKILEEYKVEAKYLNFSKISEKQLTEFFDDFNDGEKLGTPTVIFFVDGKEKTAMNRLSGEPSEKEIIRKLKQNEYIEK